MFIDRKYVETNEYYGDNNGGSDGPLDSDVNNWTFVANNA